MQSENNPNLANRLENANMNEQQLNNNNNNKSQQQIFGNRSMSYKQSKRKKQSSITVADDRATARSDIGE